MNNKFDVVILGSGNAGMAAAGVVRKAGQSVALVESWDVGGTCPLRGCVPKKVLVAAAQALDQIQRAPEHHIAVGAVHLDWGKLIARERTFVDGVSESFEAHLRAQEIELIKGRAHFVSPRQIAVNDRILDAGKIVIATGSRPRPLAIPGADLMITSDGVLELAELPESVVFVGGGVIAMEFAHVYARAGSRVTILEALPRLLPRMDTDAVAQIRKESERIGIEILTGVKVTELVKKGKDLEVHFEHEDQAHSRVATQVVNGSGRIPNVDDLDLETGGIEHDRLRIQVDAYLRSVTNPDVYVAGDALSTSAQLSPLATYEGRIVGNNIVSGNTVEPDYQSAPSNVYTVPAVATVGLTEEQATEQGLVFEAKVNDMQEWRSARTYAETASWAKVLVEDGTGRIVGAHLVGHGAEEVIHLFSFAMKYGVSAGDLVDSVYAYPTFTSDVKYLVPIS